MGAIELNCRVCGYEWDVAPWGPGGAASTHGFCPCCDVQTGYQDTLPEAARSFRNEWLSAGAHWADPGTPHDGLTTEDRLTRVPPEFR